MIKGPSHAVKIGEASKILGLHIDTLRRWEKSGKITPIRTPGGTRLYSLDELNNLVPKAPDNFSKPYTKAKQLPVKNLRRIDEEDIYVHVYNNGVVESFAYNKGVEKRIIFNGEQDYEVFLGFLEDYLTAPKNPDSIKKDFTVHGRIFQGTPHQPKNYFNQIELIAYNLMPDHFHLLLHQKTSGSIESFLRSLCTRYSMYFNKKYTRTGPLFAGPYKSVPIMDKELANLTRFFHHSKGHSSYPEYLGVRNTSWVKKDVVLTSFNKGNYSYENFVEESKVAQMPQEILLEAESEHLERRKSEDIEPVLSSVNLKPREFLTGSLVIFILLIALGIRSIWVNEYEQRLSMDKQNLKPEKSDYKQSLSMNKPSLKSEESPSQVLSTTKEVSTASAGEMRPPEEIKHEAMVKIKAEDDSIVNVREHSSTDSKIIYLAKNGDSFRVISKTLDWFEIKLASSSGFISAKYVEEEN